MKMAVVVWLGEFRMIEEGYIGIEEAANYLDIKVITLRNWIKKSDENGLPAHRVGKLWKFKKTEIDEWVTSGRSALPLRRDNSNE